jgi:peptidylprolyl isomerase
MSAPVLAVAVALGLLLGSGAAQAQPQAPGQPQAPATPPAAAAATPAATLIARRGDLSLTEAALRDMLDREAPDLREQLLRDPAAMSQYVRNRMLRLALYEEARAQRFDQRPEVAARAEQARRDAVAEALLDSLARPDAAFPAEAEVQAIYDANRTRFMVPRQYRLSQIFLAVPPGREAEDAAAQRKLREWRGQATATGRNRVEFAELARRHSEDRGSAPRGGSLDWVREDRMLEPVRNAVAGLEEGALSDPVRSDQGWHLLRVDGTRAAAPAPLAEVREQIVALLRQQRAQELARLALNELLRREPIQLDEIQLGRIAASLRPAVVAAPAGAAAAR